MHTSKSVQNTEDPEIIRHFKAGEVLHLFTNQDKIPHDGDGTTLVFDNISLSFVPEKGTAVIGLDVAEYLSFIEHRPLLTSLAAFMRLKMSDLVTNHIYFEGVSPSKVSAVYHLFHLVICHVVKCHVTSVRLSVFLNAYVSVYASVSLCVYLSVT